MVTGVSKPWEYLECCSRQGQVDSALVCSCAMDAYTAGKGPKMLKAMVVANARSGRQARMDQELMV